MSSRFALLVIPLKAWAFAKVNQLDVQLFMVLAKTAEQHVGRRRRRRPLKGLIGNATTFCAEFR